MSPRRRRSVGALVATLGLAAGIVVAPGIAQAASTPPPNPTNGQLSAAAAAKAALASKVGVLGGQVAAMQNQLQQLQANQEMAEQKFAFAESKYQDAVANAAQAKAAIITARTKVTAAQNSLRAYAQAAFMSGGVGGDAGALLTAQDPSAVLEQSALSAYESDHQVDALSQVQSASVTESNAEAASRQAEVAQAKAKADAAAAQNAADQAVVAAQAQQQQLQQTLASTQTELSAAQEQLATLNNQRTQYLAFVAQQKAIALAKARALALAEARAKAARIAAEKAAAAAAKKHHTSGSGSSSSSGSGGGGGSSTPVGAPTGGSWTPARGEAAVAKAEQYLGWMYAWAGGNRYGPTYGVCAGDGAFNDCHVKGFDCSGLALYAWGSYINLDHYAASQYGQAGSYHPSTSDLLPGDLVFWSSDGTRWGIHHVAIYIGGGNVIQAPESGEVIQITPLDQVDWGYYGATRPLT